MLFSWRVFVVSFVWKDSRKNEVGKVICLYDVELGMMGVFVLSEVSNEFS